VASAKGRFSALVEQRMAVMDRAGTPRLAMRTSGARAGE
jgi:hypothetical protein